MRHILVPALFTFVLVITLPLSAYAQRSDYAQHHSYGQHGADARHGADAQRQFDSTNAMEHEQPQPGPLTFATPPSCKDEAIDQMRRMIEEDYAFWAGGKDKALTIRQIGELQRNPSIKGGQAVLLGTLALTIDHAHGFIDRLNFDHLMELAAGKEVTVRTNPALAGSVQGFSYEPTHTFRNWVIEYQKLFENLVSNTTPEGYKLWGHESGPTIDGVKQGGVGDCYWIAAIEAVVEQRPDVIKQSIRQIGPDRFELRFAGLPEPMTVTLTHGEMCQLNLDPHEGCWLTILGLGEARIRDSQKNTPQFWRQTPLGVVAHFGSQEQVLESLLGQKYTSVNLRHTPRRAVGAMLERAMRDKMPVGISVEDHCLSLCNYNADTHKLTILNPWGCTMKYNIEGSDLIVEMDRGIFDLSLTDACRVFSTLSIPKAVAAAD